MQRFGNLEKWRQLASGDHLNVAGGRRVVIEVFTAPNSEWWWCLKREEDGDGSQWRFLTATTGNDVFEFAAPEDVCLWATGAVQYYTSAEETVHLEESGEPSFVRVANRQPRNFEFERVARQAAENVARRYEVMMAEERRELLAMAEAAGQRVDQETGEVLDDDNDGNAERPSGGDVQGEKAATPKSPSKVGDGKGGKGSGGKSTAKAESDELSDGDGGAD